MVRQNIKLTEKVLNKIIKETVNKILNEEVWGDWRDDYDAYMDVPGLNIKDPNEGTRLGNTYRERLSREYKGDKKAMQDALNNHINYRERLRRERLMQTAGGREILRHVDSNKKYDVPVNDTIKPSSMTDKDFGERLMKARKNGDIK